MAYQGGRLSDGTPLNVAVYRAYRNAGLSHTQAMAVTAEVGRENSFNPNILFGAHIDPARDKNGNIIRNIGMLSWNGGRGKNIAGYLQSRGLLGSNGMVRNQDNLNAQAAFSVREMQSKAYRGGLQNFWSNPNANPETYSRELGKNYIAWAYGQNTIRAKGGGRVAFNWQEHDARRRNYLNTLGSMLGDKTQYAPTQSQPQYVAPNDFAKLFPQLAKSQTVKSVEPSYLSPSEFAKVLPNVAKPQTAEPQYLSQDDFSKVLPQFAQPNVPVEPSYLSNDEFAKVLPHLANS